MQAFAACLACGMAICVPVVLLVCHLYMSFDSHCAAHIFLGVHYFVSAASSPTFDVFMSYYLLCNVCRFNLCRCLGCVIFFRRSVQAPRMHFVLRYVRCCYCMLPAFTRLIGVRRTRHFSAFVRIVECVVVLRVRLFVTAVGSAFLAFLPVLYCLQNVCHLRVRSCMTAVYYSSGSFAMCYNLIGISWSCVAAAVCHSFWSQSSSLFYVLYFLFDVVHFFHQCLPC